MPRRKEIPKREILPDAVYNSELAARFVNKIMERGKKSLGDRIFYRAMGLVEQRTGEDPMRVLKRALDNVKPMLETKSRRVGGSTYQIPIEVNQQRRTSLAVRWMVNYARGRGEKTMAEKLANELMDAANNRGAAVRKKEDIHRMAEANKAFAHYRW
ncbi:30S ribosomal protein S7 [Acidobacteria bacterium AH-259-L09]|nr:30S ribosomal protein S7 [Acidobacteria bacterium AH-259-L09]